MAKTRHSNISPTPSKKKAKEKETTQEIENPISPIQHICRTCLEEIQASSLIPLNDSSSNIRNELRACIPEVDFDLVPNAGMCTYCLNALHVAYEFKQKCLQTEDKIRKQLHRKLLVDLTKLKKTNNIVQVSNGDGLGLDVVYINDPIEIIDGEVETFCPLASSPLKSLNSTPLLDEEIEMINSSVNIHNDEVSVPVQEESTSIRSSSNDDDTMDDECEIITENNGNEKEGSNLLLGLSESAPRKLSVDNPVVSKKKNDSTNKINVTSDLSKLHNSKGTEVSEDVSMSDIISDDPFLCIICKNSFENVQVYVTHAKQHKPKVYKCNGCRFKSAHVLGFINHVKACSKNKRLKSKVITSKVVKQKPNEYACKNCKFVTKVQSIYKKHMRNCTTTTSKQTSKLSATPKVNVKIKLKSNEKKKVKDIPQVKKVKNDKKESTQSPTQVKFDEVNAIISASFGSLNEYKCRDCDYITDEVAAFERHVADLHQNEFPYACKDKNCHFVARVKQGIVAHMAYHYGDRKYHCTTCTYQSSTAGPLQAHIKRHEPSKKGKKWKRSY